MSTQSGNLHFYFSSRSTTARSHHVYCYGWRKPGSHTNPTSSPGQFCSCVPSRRVVRARLGTHTCGAPTEKEECAVGRVCHVSLRSGMWSPGEVSDRTLSMSPTQKGERPHETRVRRTALTTRNTDTSGNTYIHSYMHAYKLRGKVQWHTEHVIRVVSQMCVWRSRVCFFQEQQGCLFCSLPSSVRRGVTSRRARMRSPCGSFFAGRGCSWGPLRRYFIVTFYGFSDDLTASSPKALRDGRWASGQTLLVRHRDGLHRPSSW